MAWKIPIIITFRPILALGFALVTITCCFTVLYHLTIFDFNSILLESRRPVIYSREEASQIKNLTAHSLVHVEMKYKDPYQKESYVLMSEAIDR